MTPRVVVGLLRRAACTPSVVPATFKFRGHAAVGGIDGVHLSLRQVRRIRQALELLPRGQLEGCITGPFGFAGLMIRIQGARRRGLTKRLDHRRLNRSSRHILADGSPVLLTQRVAQGTRARFILHHHLGAACTTVDAAMQQRFARPGPTSRVLAIVLGIMLFAPSEPRRIGVPTDRGGVCILEADVPLLL